MLKDVAIINRAGGAVSWEALASAASGAFASVVLSDDLEVVSVGLLQAFAHEATVTLADPGSEVGAGEAVEERALKRALGGREEIRDLLRGPSAGRVRFLTSGTTGPRRAVAHGLATLSRGVRESARVKSAIWGNGYHPAHMAGIQVLMQSLTTGTPCVQLYGLGAEEMIRRIRSYGITHVSATPSTYRFLLGALKGEVMDGIQQLTLGGEALDASLAGQLEAAFPKARLRNIYASTEAGSLFVAESDCFSLRASMESKVKVVDGALWLASDLLAEPGDEATGWYPTGDLVEVIDERPLRFRFQGRTQSVINVGGYNVSPERVEAALCGHPAIVEARVYGKKNQLVGHLLMADCLTAGGSPIPPEAELRAFLSRTCQPHEMPRIFKSVDCIEKTPSGKVSR